jgi:hypothetical protein
MLLLLVVTALVAALEHGGTQGHLKEQDGLIQFLIDLHKTHTPVEVMEKMERWIKEHQDQPRGSTLSQLIPSIGEFWTVLNLREALEEYDNFSHISQRRYVAPNFAEIRHILNISQVHASAEHLQLVTFDADGTLYADGAHFEQNNKMIKLMMALLRANVRPSHPLQTPEREGEREREREGPGSPSTRGAIHRRSSCTVVGYYSSLAHEPQLGYGGARRLKSIGCRCEWPS